MDDANVVRAVALVLTAMGFSALAWAAKPSLRWTFALLFSAIVAGNLPYLAKPYIDVTPTVLNIWSVISLVLAVAATVAVGLQLRRARQQQRHAGS